MKSIATFFVALLFGVCALAAEPTNRPLGVEPENWIPLTDNLGFVVVATTEPVIPQVQGATVSRQLLLNEVSPEPPAAGYFMIKSGDGWRRLVVMTPADIVSATKG
jgi:hypothetical protein